MTEPGSPDAGSPGGRADPSSLPCVDCGHVWFDGERRHEYVPAPPPPGFRTGGDRVEVVCVLCARKRDRRPPPM
ncbi:MAG TPA: hypothetical protein VIJ51_09195 [Solirubrobacteraceae bacterium]